MSSKNLDTAVIMPAYNEESVIESTVAGVIKHFPTVIVIDDGSIDRTAEMARECGAIVLSHLCSTGQGGAIQTGIEYALNLPGVKYFATIDADGQHSVEDLIIMKKQLIENDDDIVVGSRFLGRAIDISRSKKYLLKIATVFSNKISGSKFTDTHNGIRVFNRIVARTLDIREPGYQHASEIQNKIIKNKYKYSECPVTIKYTEYSKSKGQSMLNAINIATDVLVGRVINK